MLRTAEAIEADGADSGDDAAVMARVAARDAVAFRLLVDAHATRLRSIAYRMTGDVAEAEDIAQEALLRLWEHAPRWRATGAAIGAWLTRVAMNLCFDRLRRRRFVGDEAVPDRADDAQSADAAMDHERRRAATVACVGALPERQRAAVVLTYYEELSNQMAAEAMEMNVKAFESLLMRARHALRAALADAGVLSAAMEDAR